MTRAFRRCATALATLLLVGACSSGPASTATPAVSRSATAPATATSGASNPAASVPATSTAAAAGTPCSYLTAQQVGAIVGTTPVEVAERSGRGDCDYWLTVTRASKVNIGVFTGPDAESTFETTKGIGSPQPVSLGDEAYSIFNESIGTIVVVRKGEAVVAVQVFSEALLADQLRQATALVEAILPGL